MQLKTSMQSILVSVFCLRLLRVSSFLVFFFASFVSLPSLELQLLVIPIRWLAIATKKRALL